MAAIFASTLSYEKGQDGDPVRNSSGGGWREG
jgi:hypothetical protein